MSAYAVANEHGVFERNQCERLAGGNNKKYTKEGWEVEILLAHAGEDEWYSSCSITVGTSGMGSNPSNNRPGEHRYATRQDALIGAMNDGLRYIGGMNDRRHDVAVLKAAREWLVKQCLQPKLF